MKGFVLLALLMAPPLLAAEPDPVAKLPGSLKPGVRADYVRSAGEGGFRATVSSSIATGKEAGTVEITLTSRTADLGPLTRKERIRAVFDAGRRRVRSYTFETATGKGARLRRFSTLAPAPGKKGDLLFTRYEYPKKGDPKAEETRVRPPKGLWAPDRLEPILAALAVPEPGKVASIGLFSVETGRFAHVSPTYLDLGEGKMKFGEEEVPCRILRRVRGVRKSLAYRRLADGLLLKDDAARLTLKPPEKKGKEEPK